MNQNQMNEQITGKSKTIAAIGHLTPWMGLMLPIVSLVPTFIYYRWRKNKSEFESQHLKSVFNFQLAMQTLIIASMILAVVFIVARGNQSMKEITSYAETISMAIMGISTLGSLIGFLFAITGRQSPYPKAFTVKLLSI